MYQQSYRREAWVRRAWQPCCRPLLASALGPKVRRTHTASAQYLTFMEAEPGISKRSLVLVFRKHMFKCASVHLAQPGCSGGNMGAICTTFLLPTSLFLGTVWPTSTTPVFMCWKPPDLPPTPIIPSLKFSKKEENCCCY